MRRPSLRLTLTTLPLLFIMGGILTYLYLQNLYQYYLTHPVDLDASARIMMSIEKGETGKEIAERLETLDIISSKWAFYKYIKENNLAPKLQAGKFVLKKSFTIPEIADYLIKAKNAETIILIREGLSLEEVDRWLSDLKFLPAGSFLDCSKNCVIEEHFSFLDSRPEGSSLEGYLFPDTYFVDAETINPKALIMRMLRNFDNKLGSDLRSEIAKTGRSIHEYVTMASLIEKESRGKDEKSFISGILWKRLQKKMQLDVDATVRFTLKKWKGALSKKDLETDSPYNTRKKAGLPPGPISNFGTESLRAAIMPAPSEYWYYLHDEEGNIHYAKTNDEHNLNKIRYLRAN